MHHTHRAVKSAQRVGGSTSVRFSAFAICTIFISTASRLLVSATSKVSYLRVGSLYSPSTSTTYRCISRMRSSLLRLPIT